MTTHIAPKHVRDRRAKTRLCMFCGSQEVVVRRVCHRNGQLRSPNFLCERHYAEEIAPRQARSDGTKLEACLHHHKRHNENRFDVYQALVRLGPDGVVSPYLWWHYEPI